MTSDSKTEKTLPKRPRANQGKRQREHRDKVLAEGGKYLTCELDGDTHQALNYIMQRDKLTVRQAVETSIVLNAMDGLKKP